MKIQREKNRTNVYVILIAQFNSGLHSFLFFFGVAG